ncbi:MAG: response regulator [Vicinamibacterales bacterium]
MAQVLIIDDDMARVDRCRGILEEAGYGVATSALGHEALTLMRQRTYDLVLANERLADMSGGDLCRHVHVAHPGVPTLVMNRRAIAPLEVAQAGALDLGTPPGKDELLKALETALAPRRRLPHRVTSPGVGPRGRRASSIRILVIAGGRVRRDSVGEALAGQGEVEVVALEACDDLALAARQHQPDVILLDIGPRYPDAVALIRALAGARPETRIVIVDVAQIGATLLDLVEAGASGILSEHATIDDLISTIRLVLRGATVLPGALTASMLSATAGPGRHASADVRNDGDGLTKREHEIISLLVEGLSNKEIAARLNIATFTVKSHVHNILEKLRLQSAARSRADICAPGPAACDSRPLATPMQPWPRRELRHVLAGGRRAAVAPVAHERQKGTPWRAVAARARKPA